MLLCRQRSDWGSESPGPPFAGQGSFNMDGVYTERVHPASAATIQSRVCRVRGPVPLARAWLRASVQLWNRVSGLSPTDPLAQAMRENLTMQYRPPQLWSVGFESFLRRIQALPEGGLVADEGWVMLDTGEVLQAYDT
jgi:hypothetical protein